MSKRDTYENLSDKDLWPTLDPRAAQALAPFVEGVRYSEPCYGLGHLERLLDDHTTAKCVHRSDAYPEDFVADYVETVRAEEYIPDLGEVDVAITNPPFTWSFLQPILDHLPELVDTWLLLPADMMHNKRMAPYMGSCERVVSVGRLYWMENRVRGVDNFAWYLFCNKEDSWGYRTEFNTNPIWNDS